ncbi:hypothetical protein Pfo_003275 [Paulownia fortunei]|nr:hypothetical protein Pfo_003275 [Paulownia fortunei]
MALGQRQLVVLLLLFFLLVVSSTAVPISRSLKTVKNQISVGNFHSQDEGLLKLEGLVEGRMSLELADYPGTGANHNHDPRPPGRL